MGKKSTPKAPDYTAAAEKTSAGNLENLTQQTWANRANQNTPWGSTSWNAAQTIDPATGKPVTQWTENTTLDPKLQAALNSQINIQQGRSNLAESLMGRAADEFGGIMDWSSLPAWASGPKAGNLQATTQAGGQPNLQTGLNFSGVQDVGSSDEVRKRAEDAIYQSAESRLNPQWEQQERRMQTRLANQGITGNSDSMSRALRDFDTGRNDAYAQARREAITGGGVEAARSHAMDLALRGQQVGEIGQQGDFRNNALAQQYGMGLAGQQQAFGQQQAAGSQNFGQGMASAQFQNQLRQQQAQEEMQRRGFTLNEINSILSGQQVGMPQFAGYGQAGYTPGTDYLGAATQQYGAANAAQQGQAAQAGQTASTVGALAGTALMVF